MAGTTTTARTTAKTPAKATLDSASAKAIERITNVIGDTQWGPAIDLICALHLKYIKEEMEK